MVASQTPSLFPAVEDYELRLAKRKKQIEGHYKNNLLSKVIPIIHNPRKCRELRDQIVRIFNHLLLNPKNQQIFFQIADSMEKYPPYKSNQQVDKNGRLNSLEEKVFISHQLSKDPIFSIF